MAGVVWVRACMSTPYLSIIAKRASGTSLFFPNPLLEPRNPGFVSRSATVFFVA